MRALLPTDEGFVERDGVRSFYEVYGEGGPTVLFLPTWSIVHSRIWKAQLPYFGRHFRALTFDGRGNGRSDRPVEQAAYHTEEFAADALAVMDATDTAEAIVVGFSRGAQTALALAADNGERVTGACFVGSLFPLSRTSRLLRERLSPFFMRRAPAISWGKFNGRYWLRDYPGFVDWWMNKVFAEPHSTKQIEDAKRWALQTSPEVAVATMLAQVLPDQRYTLAAEAQLALAGRVRCPALVVHGARDTISRTGDARALAAATGGTLRIFPDVGHGLAARKPVAFNLALREFVESVAAGGREQPAGALAKETT